MAKSRKAAISWNKFKRLALRGGSKVSQKEQEKEDEVLVCICFGIIRLVWILIMNSGICLLEWVRVSSENKCRYKHNLDSHEIEI